MPLYRDDGAEEQTPMYDDHRLSFQESLERVLRGKLVDVFMLAAC